MSLEAWNYSLPIDTFIDKDDDTLDYSIELDSSDQIKWLDIQVDEYIVLNGTPLPELRGASHMITVIASDREAQTNVTFNLEVSNNQPIQTNNITN